MRRSAALLLALLVACTGDEAPPSGRSASPGPTEAPSADPPPVATIRLVARDEPHLQSYVEGIRFAADEVGARGTLDLRILEAPSVDTALRLGPDAILVVDDPGAIANERPAIEEARTPVVAVGGDLYSPRQLFRYAFQTAVPLRWQARVIAGYLLEDRGHDSTRLLTTMETNAPAGEAFNGAWSEEGASLEAIAFAPPDELESVAAELAGLDSVVFTGPATQAASLSRGLSRVEDPPQLVLSSDALDVSFVTQNRPTPGTVTCYTYAWSGWADMLPRVHDFRERFSAAVGHLPASLEQEGYDAVMALADALERTEGEGGDALVAELETFRDETYSSMPVRLGPDDHVFAEESHLGLFAVEEPVDAALPEGEASSLVSWRPIMRTFTTDGEKVNLLDRDKRIFFPFWRPKRPSPKYWRSEYGIVSRRSDPLH